MKFLMKNLGLTLVELGTVVIIIGLLMTISLVAIAPAREKARDVRRKADLERLFGILEIYRHDHNDIYPIWTQGGCLENKTAPGNPFIETETPSDPLRGKGHCYYYKTNLDGTNFHLLAKMEKDSGLAINDGGLFLEYYEIFSQGGQELITVNASSTEIQTAMSQ